MARYVHLGGMFWKSDSAVFCEGQPLKLSPAATKVFYKTWATDGHTVYRFSFRYPKIDAASFVALNVLYAKDAANCYVDSISNQGGLKVIKGADATTFQVLDSGNEKLMFGLGRNGDGGFAKDSGQVYFEGNLVKNAEPTSFGSLGNCYGRDSSSVFFTRFRLNGADPLRWRFIGGRYSHDDENVFYENRGLKDVDVDQLRQIEPFDSEFAYDGSTILYRGDPTTVEYYAKCLRSDSKHCGEFADIVESGVWQKYFRASNWSYRAPDDVLTAFKGIQLGATQSELVKQLGNGEVVPRDRWDFFFPPLDKLIRLGFCTGAGTAPWSGENATTPPGCEVYRWSHPEQVLACSFVEGRVASFVILDAESVPWQKQPATARD